MPPVRPMLAKPAAALPTAASHLAGWLYEPKWDGFRCVVFRDGDEVELGSRNEKPLTRYFPEVVEAVRRQLPPRCVVDGEVVIATDAGLDFEALLQRIHPADSRVRKLSVETPASLVAFDLLALDDLALVDLPFVERRAALEQVLAGATPPVHLTPATTEEAQAREWFARFEGAGLDGVVAKPRDLPYRQNERLMTKVKHARTADCVVAGFRWHKSGPVVGSLLLGLYDGPDDDPGQLQHVGVAAAFPMARRRSLVDELAPYRTGALDGHPWAAWASAADGDRMPGGEPSRWNRTKDLSWEPLRPELVCEVSYDHMEGPRGHPRFRHTAQWKSWRPDRAPTSCGYGQLEEPVPYDLAAIFGR